MRSQIIILVLMAMKLADGLPKWFLADVEKSEEEVESEKHYTVQEEEASSADKWPNLKTTVSLNLSYTYATQPRTRADAKAAGYSLIAPDAACDGTTLGWAYADPDEPSFVALYDDAGYIAGVQNVLLKDHIDSNYMVPGPAYTPGTFFGQEALFTTMYFVDTAVICNGGRTEEQWMAQGTGDRLWLQNGPTPDVLVDIPLTQEEAAAQENWKEHYCFLGMGKHFIEFDYTPDQDCNSVLPVQILYDAGVITGFVFQHNGMFPGNRWEHPTSGPIGMIVDRPPTCLLNTADTIGATTMHFFLYNYPQLTLCPLCIPFIDC